MRFACDEHLHCCRVPLYLKWCRWLQCVGHKPVQSLHPHGHLLIRCCWGNSSTWLTFDHILFPVVFSTKQVFCFFLFRGREGGSSAFAKTCTREQESYTVQTVKLLYTIICEFRQTKTTNFCSGETYRYSFSHSTNTIKCSKKTMMWTKEEPSVVTRLQS